MPLEVTDGIPGWVSHKEFLDYAVNSFPQDSTFYEVGVLFGASSNYLATTINRSGKKLLMILWQQWVIQVIQ